MNEKCRVCGWNLGKLDNHHVIPLKWGGIDIDDNLIKLCPNCHSIASLDEEKFMKENNLKGVSYPKEFEEWCRRYLLYCHKQNWDKRIFSNITMHKIKPTQVINYLKERGL